MEYYRSSSVVDVEAAGEETTLPGANVAAMNARLEASGDGAGMYAVYADRAAPHGIAFLTAYRAGALHTIHIVLKPGRARAFRIEAHGGVTKMQKSVAIVGADGSLFSQAEEVSRVKSRMRVDGVTLDVEFEFVPFRSLVEWFYVFGSDIGDTADGNAPLFHVSAFRIFVTPLPSEFKCAAHLPAEDVAGTLVACQNMLVLRNYVHLHVELHRPGTELTGLDLITADPVAYAQWWTWNPPPAIAKVPVRDGAIRLRARKPSSPVSSPALLDELGPAFAHVGHAITFVFADLFDPTKLTAEAADQKCSVILHAHFNDGHSQTIDVWRDLASRSGEENRWIKMTLRYLDDLKSVVGDGAFLEAGARGGASAHMRQLVSGRGWRYMGIDISADANVDIVADVHSMAPAVADDSVAAVYSSEVMEHLLAPSNFVREAHRVLVAGGLFIARVPTTWPLHAEPWDFWRFSRHAWQGLLNKETGFEILELCEFGEASIIPSLPFWKGALLMSNSPAPMLTGVIARKIRSPEPGSHGSGANLPLGSYNPA